MADQAFDHVHSLRTAVSAARVLHERSVVVSVDDLEKVIGSIDAPVVLASPRDGESDASRASARRREGGSFHDQPVHGWPRRRVIWSCTARRGPLLTRFYLVDSRRLAIYLHRLHVSDDDRALHDHPWSFITVLLSSGYYEHTPSMQRLGTVRTWHRRFSVLYRPAEWKHRLELLRPTWTLVVRFRRRREWGFLTNQGWMHWRTYGARWCD